MRDEITLAKIAGQAAFENLKEINQKAYAGTLLHEYQDDIKTKAKEFWRERFTEAEIDRRVKNYFESMGMPMYESHDGMIL